MQKARITYFTVVFLIILTGISSRKLDLVPLFVGDVLYAMMIYFMVRFIFPIKKPCFIFISALLLCYAIEFQQRIDIGWLVTIRKTVSGHYILGQGFLWSDLIGYFAGVLLCYCVEIFFYKSN